jgi:transcriptional regulator
MGDSRRGDLLQGTLDMLILKVLDGGVMHGFAIAERIHQWSDDELRIEEGALYPALHRLEVRGWLAGDWGHSANNRRAKTPAPPLGRRQLCSRPGRGALSTAVSRVMEMA